MASRDNKWNFVNLCENFEFFVVSVFLPQRITKKTIVNLRALRGGKNYRSMPDARSTIFITAALVPAGTRALRAAPLAQAESATSPRRLGNF